MTLSNYPNSSLTRPSDIIPMVVETTNRGERGLTTSIRCSCESASFFSARQSTTRSPT